MVRSAHAQSSARALEGDALAVPTAEARRAAAEASCLAGLAPLRLNELAYDVFIAVAAAEVDGSSATVHGIARITGRRKNANGIGGALHAFTQAGLVERRFEEYRQDGKVQRGREVRAWYLTAFGRRVLEGRHFSLVKAWKRLHDSGLLPPVRHGL